MQSQSQTKSKPVALPSQEQEPQRQQTPKSEGALHCLPQSAGRQRSSSDSASSCQEWQLGKDPAHSDSLGCAIPLDRQGHEREPVLSSVLNPALALPSVQSGPAYLLGIEKRSRRFACCYLLKFVHAVSPRRCGQFMRQITISLHTTHLFQNPNRQEVAPKDPY